MPFKGVSIGHVLAPTSTMEVGGRNHDNLPKLNPVIILSQLPDKLLMNYKGKRMDPFLRLLGSRKDYGRVFEAWAAMTMRDLR